MQQPPAWLTSDIKLVGGEVLVVSGQKEEIEPYKLKNRVEFISRSQHVNHIQLAQKACLQLITRRTVNVLGLDCEWNWRGGSSGVDLIQIATPTVNILLHQFERLPPELIKILGNEQIKKVGVNVAPDLGLGILIINQ